MRSRSVCVVVLLLGTALCGCAANPSPPPAWLPTPKEAQTDPRGGWIRVQTLDAHDVERTVEGELLAVERDALYIADSTFARRVPYEIVRTARLREFKPEAGAVVGATVGGMLLTVSNGWFLFFTAPTWLLVGTGAAAGRASDGLVTEKADWDAFRRFARFPQGLPSQYATARPAHADSTRVSGPGPPVPEPARAPPPPVPVVSVLEADHPPRVAWVNAGVGPSFGAEVGGVGVMAGVNVGIRSAVVTLRASRARMDDEPPGYGRSLHDVALLVGAHVTPGVFHVSFSLGPAWYGLSFADALDVADAERALAGQAELLVRSERSVAVGAVLTWNWNDFRDFFVLSFAVSIGR